MRKFIGVICTLALFVTLFAGMAMPITAEEVFFADTTSAEAVSSEYGVETAQTLPQTTTTYTEVATTAVIITETTQRPPQTTQAANTTAAPFTTTGPYINTTVATGQTYRAGDFTYTVSGNKATVTAYSGTKEDVEIPATMGGYEVVGIGQAAFATSEFLKTVTIPDSVTDIGDYAFTGCGSLVSVQLPSRLQTMGYSTFVNCVSLEDITLPSGLTAIEDLAFAYCYSLASITIPDGVTRIGWNAFRDCTSLTTITIPGSVESVEAYAFFACYDLKSAVLCEGVTSLGDDVFWACYNLESVVIPTTLTNVGYGAFDKSVQDVYYGGSKKQWATITFADDYLDYVRIHYNANGEHWTFAKEMYPAACEWGGLALYTCDCGYEYEEYIPPKGHNGVVIDVIEPTCTSVGYTVYKCAECYEIYSGEDVYVNYTFRDNVCVGCGRDVSECLASAHKYANNCDKTWRVYQPGAQSIRLTFSAETETDDGYDFIYIYDGDDNLVGAYTGTQLAAQTITVIGDTAKIRLVADDSMNYYGFAVTNVEEVYRALGDINGDGLVKLADAMQAFYHVARQITLADSAFTAADINGDGEIKIGDAMKIFYYVAKQIDTLI